MKMLFILLQECECNGSLKLNRQRDAHIGQCLTEDKTGKFFCFVNPKSGCADKARWQHSGAFFSYRGCEIMAASDIFLPRTQRKRVRSAIAKRRADAQLQQRG